MFFGEQLPKQFYLADKIVSEADLVFVIGTSLAVMPFAFLVESINPKVPKILINNTDSLAGKKKIWMEGDIQENINKIAKDLDWIL